ncbi:MAG: family 10 glycosylhydrolase [Defluviitaleaceae bacterium]|nr:family 10 glycosylhydrolase [Defluviitaleaceae bacterium]
MKRFFSIKFKNRTCVALAWLITVVTVFAGLEFTQVFSFEAAGAESSASVPASIPASIPASVEMRGLWVTTAYNLDWPSRRGLSPNEMKREVDIILDRAVSQGINAIFLQVRPTADAFYPSEIFPWSHLLTGTQGEAPAAGFDPLAYWIERGHALGIEIHAWLNPYRVTFPNQNITDPAYLAENHPARLNPDLVVTYRTSLFFDPGNPAARQLIIDGVEELLRNYNLDGIHLDDYFYPSRSFPDSHTFARYGGNADLHDWRRENVNTLIRDLQTVVRETRPRARFGISPTAIWKNDTTDPLGSATRGMESFHAAYADTRRWVTEGWIDYIVPQIYWFTGFEIACYEVVLSWWEDVVRGTDVSLYIGHAVYREVENRANWSGEIVRQLQRNSRSDVVRGSIFFRARHMDSEVGEQIRQFYTSNIPAQVPTPPIDAPAVLMSQLLVAQPSGNRTGDRAMANASGFYFFGSGVPDIPVYVNDRLITNRTDEGFFSIFMPLVHGENTFTFTQQGQNPVTRVIQNNPPAPAAPPATMAQAGVTSAFPASAEYARVGTTLTLSANAPAGATVTAEIGGQTIRLTQATNTNLTATAGNIISARFTGSFTLNSDEPANAVTDIGRPVYTAVWNGQTLTATSAGTIRQIGMYAPLFAEVTAGSAWAFPGATTTSGSHWQLHRGQTDRVAAISGNWTRLASGGWIENTNVRRFNDAELAQPASDLRGNIGFLSEGRYLPGVLDAGDVFQDVIIWNSPYNIATWAEFDGNELIFVLGKQSVAPPIFFNPDETLFSEIRIGTHNGSPAYFMTLRDGAFLEGFYTEYENGQLRLVLRRRRPLTPGNYPFAGFTFVIDAGHGGTDPGAVGPMGRAMSEAMLVLNHALLLQERLEMLGAEVIMTRETDIFSPPQDRVPISRAHKPDMFISLHTNATAETTDATNIHGFTVWFRNPNSRPAAAMFMDSMRYVNPLSNRNNAPSQANFYVCRPAWAPSILLEASFTNNIRDFAWMINERRQIDYAWGIVNALLRYYAP